jgi:hypothetical protein
MRQALKNIEKVISKSVPDINPVMTEAVS